MTTYVLDLPDQPYPSLNGRLHWARLQALMDQWKNDTHVLALAGCPRGLARVEVELVLVPTDRRRQDPDNLGLALKACIDGLRAARVIADDDASHVARVSCRIAPPEGRRRWLLTIADLTPEQT